MVVVVLVVVGFWVVERGVRRMVRKRRLGGGMCVR